MVALLQKLLPVTITSRKLAFVLPLLTLLVLLPITNVFAEAAPSPDVRADWFNVIILNFLWAIVVNVFGTWLWLAGFVLNYAVGMFVINFGNQYILTGLGAQIDTLWGLIRDLFNLTFIFGLVYLGIRMILNSDDASTKRNIIFLIMAALLVNFSLFFTKIIIDFSNVAATELTNVMLNMPGFTNVEIPPVISGGAPTRVPDIAGYISTTLQLASLFGGGPNFRDLAASAGYAYVIFVAIFLIVTGFVFISGGLLLISRFIALNFYMLFSPIMFLGWVFPNFQDVSRKYWKGFLGRAFFAPLYILGIYIVLVIMQGYLGRQVSNPGIDGGRVTDMFSINPEIDAVNAGFLSFVIPFILMTGFMLGALTISKKLGVDGANMAVSLGDNLQKRGRRFAMRNTAGLGAYGLSAAATGVNSVYNRMDAGASRTQTRRNLRRIANVVTLGATSDRVIQSALKGARGASVAGSETYDQAKTRVAQRDQRRDTEIVVAEGLAAQKEVDAAKANGSWNPAVNTYHKELEQKVQKIQNAAAQFSTKQFEAMSQKQRVELAAFMSNSQTDSLMKSDSLTDTEKSSIAEKRSEILKRTVTDSGGVITEQLNKLTLSQIETLGADFVKQNAHLFNDSQIAEIKKSKKFTESQIGSFTTTRNATFDTYANANRGAGDVNGIKSIMQERTSTGSFKNRKATEVAQLPASVLITTAALPFITDKVLREIAVKGSLSPRDQQKLEQLITTFPTMSDASAINYFSTTHAKNNWG